MLHPKNTSKKISRQLGRIRSDNSSTAHKMVQKLARVAAPCLRQLGQGSNSSARACLVSSRHFSSTSNTQYATAAAVAGVRIPIDHAPATKPPSARPVETRKSQLIRTYTSLLRTTPLILFFQHSNLTAVEWAAVRRELKKALAAVPPPNAIPGAPKPLDVAPLVKLQVLRTNMLNVALKIIEFHNPEVSAQLPNTPRTTRGPLTHDLSAAAYEAISKAEAPADSAYAQIEPLMVGPLAALVMPSVSPAHLAAALSILAPVPGQFPAPTRRKGPGYHDAICQNGLSKLLLVGGRIENKIFDQAGVNWVGGIGGGLDGLRAQLVRVLEGAGLGITTALEGGSRSLWMTLESRKLDLEEKSGEKKPDA